MDDDQQFCLRWNNHQSTLVAVFDTLLENGTLVDCTLAAEGKYLNAHKVVLSACSPYFESLLSQNYDKHPIFILKDVKFQELKAMMDYMYRGEVNISQDQLGALLKAAESLQIKGLSDNKKDSEPRKAAPPPIAKSPPPSATLPRVQGLTIEQRRANRSMEEREGSQSPGPRKRKRMRRRSTDDLDNHDASNSSESHSNPPIQNIPIALPPPTSSKILSEVPEPVETKSEILRHKEPEIAQVPIIKEKIETHTELMLEPKAEYVEEMNEDSIEDLTLDDDDVSNLDMSNNGAGPSHGNMGDASGQGFGWHMGNQNQDEVFLAAQEAVGAHRDNQDFMDSLDPARTRKPSEFQKQTMINFLKLHPRLVIGQFGNDFRHKDAEMLWRELTDMLNSFPDGARKSWKCWRKTWQDMRSRAKMKISKKGTKIPRGQCVTVTEGLLSKTEKDVLMHIVMPDPFHPDDIAEDMQTQFLESEMVSEVQVKSEEQWF